jgi:hypothetical protein
LSVWSMTGKAAPAGTGHHRGCGGTGCEASGP